MPKKILTLDNLYKFFVEQNQTINFSVKDSGTPIVVTTDGFFSESESDMPGMMQVELKVCHIDTNRNGSHISKENMEKAMPTLKYRPILAYIHELDDGTKDFYAHNVEVVENEDGESEIHYVEKQVGCFKADNPWLKYDKKMDKTYVHAYAVIPEEYTETADIIRRKNGTKVSCELVINELSYNAKEKYLDLTDFYFGGCTLLGCDEDGNEIGEGMLGSSIVDFCHKEPVFNYQDKLIETLERLNFTLESLNKTNAEEKGGEKVMGRFEELLAQYGKAADEVTFEYENLSDEELEAAFKEAFEDASEDENASNANSTDDTTDDDVQTTDDGNGDNTTDDNGTDGTDGEPEKFTKTFTVELSHDDIRNALYTLIRQYENDDEYFYIREVFDSYFVMQDWWNNKIYKQSYAVDGENVSLEGSRIEVYEILVTKEEKDALDALKENYSALEVKYNELKAFKDTYDATELESKKMEVLDKAEYECLAENKDFAQLRTDMDKYSVEEISTKADLIFAAYMKSKMDFSAKDEGKKKPQVLSFGVDNKKEKKKKAYGNLFAD